MNIKYKTFHGTKHSHIIYYLLLLVREMYGGAPIYP